MSDHCFPVSLTSPGASLQLNLSRCTNKIIMGKRCMVHYTFPARGTSIKIGFRWLTFCTNDSIPPNIDRDRTSAVFRTVHYTHSEICHCLCIKYSNDILNTEIYRQFVRIPFTRFTFNAQSSSLIVISFQWWRPGCTCNLYAT